MYLDPGVGGMLVQIIIAIAAVGGALLFSMRKKIKAFFAGKKTAGKQTDISSVDDGDAIDVLADEEA